MIKECSNSLKMIWMIIKPLEHDSRAYAYTLTRAVSDYVYVAWLEIEFVLTYNVCK